MGQIDYEQEISIDLSNVTVSKALKIISDSTQYYFAYKEGVTDQLNGSALINYEKTTLNAVLLAFTESTPITYLYRENQVILKMKNKPARKQFLVGQLVVNGTGMGLPYGTIEVKNQYKGVVADYEGKFKLELKDLNEKDTLLISSLGYTRTEIPFNSLDTKDSVFFNLNESIIQIETYNVEFPSFITRKVGESGKKAQGEMYMDTNGQQTALFIDNKEDLEGKIEKLKFYLSKKGNIKAPFKVHIYRVDDLSGGPGKDLFDQFVVAQPDITNGWFEIDVLLLDIDIPKNGFYIGMEGVFPDEAVYTTIVENQKKGKGKLKKKKDIFLSALSYGQRLGFKKAKQNLTWHYSLSGNWFQLEKQSFNVMIGAELLVEPKISDK